MAKRKQTRRQEYNKAVSKLARRLKYLAKAYNITSFDIKIKPEGRVTKKDVEYIESFNRNKLKEAVKTVDVGTGKQITIRQYEKAKREAVNFARATIDSWKARVREMDGKLSDKLIQFIDNTISRIGTEAVSDGLVKLEEKGVSLTYQTINYEAECAGYMTEMLNSIDALGANSFTRQELEEQANDIFYDIAEEYEEG